MNFNETLLIALGNVNTALNSTLDRFQDKTISFILDISDKLPDLGKIPIEFNIETLESVQQYLDKNDSSKQYQVHYDQIEIGLNGSLQLHKLIYDKLNASSSKRLLDIIDEMQCAILGDTNSSAQSND